MRAVQSKSPPTPIFDAAVLITARDREAADLYKAQLAQAKLPAFVVPDVVNAVATLGSDEAPAVLLVDTESPEAGLALIADIKRKVAIQDWLRVILISSQPTGDCSVAIANADISACLVRPVTPAALVEVVVRVREAARSAHLHSRNERHMKTTLEQVSRLGESARQIIQQLQVVTAELQDAAKSKVQLGSVDPDGGALADVTLALETLGCIDQLDEMRCMVLPGQFQSDPAWNMLSELARSRLLKKNISTTSLCLASKAPVTTALRKLEQLIEDGFALRVPDAGDNRRTHIEPTAKGQQAVMTVIGSMQSQSH